MNEIKKKTGQRWKTLTPKEKQPYIEEAERIRQLHTEIYPDYKYQPRRKSQGGKKSNSSTPDNSNNNTPVGSPNPVTPVESSSSTKAGDLHKIQDVVPSAPSKIVTPLSTSSTSVVTNTVITTNKINEYFQNQNHLVSSSSSSYQQANNVSYDAQHQHQQRSNSTCHATVNDTSNISSLQPQTQQGYQLSEGSISCSENPGTQTNTNNNNNSFPPTPNNNSFPPTPNLSPVTIDHQRQMFLFDHLQAAFPNNTSSDQSTMSLNVDQQQDLNQSWLAYNLQQGGVTAYENNFNQDPYQEMGGPASYQQLSMQYNDYGNNNNSSSNTTNMVNAGNQQTFYSPPDQMGFIGNSYGKSTYGGNPQSSNGSSPSYIQNYNGVSHHPQ